MQIAFPLAMILVGVVFLFVGGFVFRQSIAFLAASAADYRYARNNAPKRFWEAMTGNFDPYSRHRRDDAVSAGLAVDKKGELIPQGRLSDEVVDPLI